MFWSSVQRAYAVEVFLKNGMVTWSGRQDPLILHHASFLWGYLKDNLYRTRPRSVRELKEAIQAALERIPPDMTRRAMESFRDRLQQCVAARGRHLGDVIFKTN